MVKRPFAAAAAAVAVLAGAGNAPAGAQAHPPAQASIAVDDDTPAPGQSITVTMSPCRSRTFALSGLDLLLLGAARTGPDDVASTAITIPQFVRSGSHTVSGWCIGADRRPLFLRATITVVARTGPPPSTAPATTAPPTTAPPTTAPPTTAPPTTAPPTTAPPTPTTAPPTTAPPTTAPPTTAPPPTEPPPETGAAVPPPANPGGRGPGTGAGATGGRRTPGSQGPSPDPLAGPALPTDATAMFEDAAAANGVPAVPTPAASSRTPAQDGAEGTDAPATGDAGDRDLGPMPTLARVALGLAAIGGVPVALAFSRGPRAEPRRRRLPFLGERFA